MRLVIFFISLEEVMNNVVRNVLSTVIAGAFALITAAVTIRTSIHLRQDMKQRWLKALTLRNLVTQVFW